MNLWASIASLQRWGSYWTGRSAGRSTFLTSCGACPRKVVPLTILGQLRFCAAHRAAPTAISGKFGGVQLAVMVGIQRAKGLGQFLVSSRFRLADRTILVGVQLAHARAGSRR